MTKSSYEACYDNIKVIKNDLCPFYADFKANAPVLIQAHDRGMKSMQESIDYCMTFVSENIEKNDEEHFAETYEHYEGTAPTVSRFQEQDTEENLDIYTEISVDTPVGEITEEPVSTPVTEPPLPQETAEPLFIFP